MSTGPACSGSTPRLIPLPVIFSGGEWGDLDKRASCIALPCVKATIANQQTEARHRTISNIMQAPPSPDVRLQTGWQAVEAHLI
jgi:hypothetical protein